MNKMNNDKVEEYKQKIADIREVGRYIQLPRLGKVKLFEQNYLPTNSKVLSATVSHRAGKFFVSLQVEEEHKPLKKTKKVIGVDLGIKTLATLADRLYKCSNCNLEIDRDFNASLNLVEWYRESCKRGSLRRLWVL